jgi:phosphatidylglycerol:prolipoprotein diacylglycerol transferase
MYLFGFASSYLLVKLQIIKKRLPVPRDFESSLYSYIIIGLLIGARLGYVIFYDLAAYVRKPLEVFAVWHGGMSFHGGLVGCFIAGILFSRKMQIDFWQTADLVIVTAPIGLGLGRIGNFINGELYGRVSDVPWAMAFPGGGSLPRHPSQLYEFFLEGVFFFIILWTAKDRGFRTGVLTSLFFILYGLFRFFVEFLREPDPRILHHGSSDDGPDPQHGNDVFGRGDLLSAQKELAALWGTPDTQHHGHYSRTVDF